MMREICAGVVSLLAYTSVLPLLQGTTAFLRDPSADSSLLRQRCHPSNGWTGACDWQGSKCGVVRPQPSRDTPKQHMTIGQQHHRQQPIDVKRRSATSKRQTSLHAREVPSTSSAHHERDGVVPAKVEERAGPTDEETVSGGHNDVDEKAAGANARAQPLNGLSSGAGLPRHGAVAPVGFGWRRRGSMFDNAPVQTMSRDGRYTAVLIVPTGIGAAIGGYAGDALPVARAMSSVVDNLVTHPNVMNGAMLYGPEPGMQYVEGYALDEFCAGRWGLLPVTKGGHRIGLVLDCAIEEDLLLRHVQAANAARATLGINVAEYCITDAPAGVTLEMTKGGASWGTVKGLSALVAAGRRLVEEAGCTAIAVVARFPDDEDEDALQAYREGQGVDAVGGAEAIISHVMSQELKVPCAHAPALPPIDADESVSPRACAEELGYTFLPCVLANLHRAPSLITSRQHPRAAEALWADAVDAVVAPATAFGGAGVLSLAEQTTTLLVAVEDNATVMKARADELLAGHSSSTRGVTVSSYLEAVGVLAAHKAGVNPACLTVDIPPVRKMPPSSGNVPSVEASSSAEKIPSVASRLVDRDIDHGGLREDSEVRGDAHRDAARAPALAE